MDEKISLIDKGHYARLHVYEIGIHNMKDKEIFSDDDIEQISQKIKEQFIETLYKQQQKLK